MEINHDIEERVLALVACELAVPRAGIHPLVEIEASLGCSGDDAWDLMEKLSREFAIDMSGFDFDRHFDPELPGPLLWLFFAMAVVLTIPIALTVSEFLVNDLPRSIEFAVILALVLPASFLIAGCAYSRLPSEQRRNARRIPVTIQQLIAAATLERWPMCYLKGAPA